mmetsp:Transcript_32888/g.79247  ORF Transcript_32888/g.79247 Transcript_32888/m.79247 type:complete len:205 (-) Transcript_32888:485-1099(-)
MFMKPHPRQAGPLVTAVLPSGDVHEAGPVRLQTLGDHDERHLVVPAGVDLSDQGVLHYGCQLPQQRGRRGCGGCSGGRGGRGTHQSHPHFPAELAPQIVRPHRHLRPRGDRRGALGLQHPAVVIVPARLLQDRIARGQADGADLHLLPGELLGEVELCPNEAVDELVAEDHLMARGLDGHLFPGRFHLDRWRVHHRRRRFRAAE